MTPTKEARILSQALAGGLKVDGEIGPKSKERFRGILGIDLEKNRLIAGIIQRATQIRPPEGVPTLRLDYWYGPATDFAVEAWTAHLAGSTLPKRPDETRQRPRPKCARPSDRAMIKAYGEPGTFQQTFVLPYPVRLAWATDMIVTRATMHQSLVEETRRALEQVGRAYSRDEREQLGLNLYGGSLSVRKKRGGSTWSAHAFGAAMDWDPDHNRLRQDHTEARFAGQAYDKWWGIWEENGFMSLGRCYDFDWMHVQHNP